MKQATWLMLSVLCPLLGASVNINIEEFKQSVVFIYAAAGNGNVDEQHPLGTGFLVHVGSNAQPKLGWLFLVTARHIVDPAWAHCPEPQPSIVYLRMNKTGYDPSKDTTGVAYLPIRLLENGQKKYFVRDDDDRVDAAVMDIGWQNLPQDKYDYAPPGLNLFASPDEIKKLSIGDSIISAGLIPGRSGERRNYPFFKFGNISNIPDEPTWIVCRQGMPQRLERVWFVAANLVGGNSGSPIAYLPTGGGELTRPMLVGLQSSSFAEADIAGMTPIEDVFKIIKRICPDGDLYRGDPAKKPKQ